MKYAIAIIALLVVAYNSVYFKKLDKVQATAASKNFDAAAYAKEYFHNKLIPSLNKAVEINQLVALLQNDKEKTFDQYGHALGISNVRFFLVKGEGKITAINENDVSLLVATDTLKRKVQIATEFIFGNAIRDASGLIDMNEFKNTMDFNNVSAELNKIVRSEVVPSFKASAKKGDTVQFYGVVEWNRKHPDVTDMEVIPISLKVIKGANH